MYKLCPNCDVEKSHENFNKDKSKRDGFCSWCRECSSTRASEWRKKNAARNLELKRNWQKKNRGKINQENKEAAAKIKTKVIDFFGGCCKLCGGIENLTLDHPNKDGLRHREEINVGAGLPFYRFLLKNNFDTNVYDIRVLCNVCHGIADRDMSCILSESQVKSIRERYTTEDISQRKLAEEFEVSVGTINQVLHHKLWRTV